MKTIRIYIGAMIGGILILSSITKADVNLNPPSFDESSCVTLIGDRGAYQKSIYQVYTYKVNEQNQPIAFSSSVVGQSTLNSKICNVPSGPLQITYSGMVYFADKSSGFELKVNLKKINLPASTEATGFSVFRDFTNGEEQAKLLKGIFIEDSNRFVYERLSKQVDLVPFYEKFKASVDTNNPTMLDFLVSFNTEAERSYLDIFYSQQTPKWLNFERTHVTQFPFTHQPNAGFINVLPGVYGVSWENSKKLRVLNLGIRVD